MSSSPLSQTSRWSAVSSAPSGHSTTRYSSLTTLDFKADNIVAGPVEIQTSFTSSQPNPGYMNPIVSSSG
jgi:hypothetical protein